MLGSRGLVLAVVLLGLAQKIRQEADVQVESASGKPRRDLLEQPLVAVRILESRPGEIGAILWILARQPPFRIADAKLILEMERLADGGALLGQTRARFLDVVDDEEQSLRRTGRGIRDSSLAEDDRTR